MSRQFTCGFEPQTVANGAEYTSTTTGGGGSVTIDTTVKRSGSASLKVISSSTGSNYIEHIYNSSNVVTYVSFALRVNAYPTDTHGALCELVASGGSVCASLAITTAGRLRLYDGNIAGTQRGSDSGILSLDTWYIVQLKIENGAGTEIEARLAVDDGVATPSVFASGAMTVASNANTLHLGMSDFVASFIAFFDDVKVNSDATSSENTYPSHLSKLAFARPTGAGDNNPTAGNAASINESPVSDTVTSSANRIELDTNTTIADFAMTDSWALGIHPQDTIVLLDLLVRIREETSTASGYKTRIKSASGGTVLESNGGTALDAGNTTLRTNPNGTTAFTNRLVSYTDPTTGVAWTPTGTNSIDNFQAGVASTTTNDLFVAWLGVYVEYIENTTGIRRDAVSTGQNDGQSSITISHTTGSQSNRLIVVKIHTEANANPANRPVVSVTYDSVPLTKVDDELSTSPGGEDGSLEIYYGLAPSSGTHDAVVTFTGAVEGCVVAVETYYNVAQTSPVDDFATTSTTSTGPLQDTLTTTQDYDLIVDAAGGMSSSNLLTTNSGQSSNYNVVNSGQLVAAGGYKVVGVAGNYTPSWAVNVNADWLFGAVAFKRYVPSGGSQIKKFMSINQANLKKVSTITNANMKKLVGVSNV